MWRGLRGLLRRMSWLCCSRGAAAPGKRAIAGDMENLIFFFWHQNLTSLGHSYTMGRFLETVACAVAVAGDAL